MEYILIFISAIFVNNIILSQFLGRQQYHPVAVPRYLSFLGRLQEG